MGEYIITSITAKKTLYRGEFRSFRRCLEQAVKDGVVLENADLRRKNLCFAVLDDARLPGADLTGANLTGANLSEACLAGAIFDHADLYNTCLAYADLQRTRFGYCGFGATNITGADLGHAAFAGLSTFTLDFGLARNLTGCAYFPQHGSPLLVETAPLVLRGLTVNPLILIGNMFLVNDRVQTVSPSARGILYNYS